MKKIMIVAGEASGDINGSELALSLKKIAPDLELSGIGGKRMKEAGVEILFDMTGFAVVGFTEVIRNLKKFRTVFREFCRKMLEEKPLAIILIDYPGFNMRLAEKAKKNGITVIYYISPQVWAWGRDRVKKLAKIVDKMLVIFSFEKDFYRDSGMEVEFVGHPILDRIKQSTKAGEHENGLKSSNRVPVVALLPGSRKQEINRHLPIMLKAGMLMRKQMPGVRFVIPCASTISPEEVKNILGKYSLNVSVIENRTYEVMDSSDLIIACSGTATIESACLLKPLIVLYKVSFISWFIMKWMIRVRNIAMVNVMAHKRIVPEFLQFRAKPSLIAEEALSLLRDIKKRRKMIEELLIVRDKLGAPGASERAAKAVLRTIEGDFKNGE